MNDIEQIEIDRYRREIVEDLRHMLKKYHRIMEWDVPDVDEGESRTLVLKAMKDALTQVQSES